MPPVHFGLTFIRPAEITSGGSTEFKDTMPRKQPEFVFREEDHSYWLDGDRIPGVTSIIQAVIPVFEAAEFYLIRGAATHRATELADAGTLDWSTVDPQISTRVEAWQKFRHDFPAEVIANETTVYHPLHRYGGKLDRLFLADNDLVLCDLKNSVSPQVRIQLGLYSLAWMALNKGAKIKKAVAVELKDTGDYRCLWMNERELRRAEQQSLAVLTTYNFMVQYGLKRKEKVSE